MWGVIFAACVIFLFPVFRKMGRTEMSEQILLVVCRSLPPDHLILNFIE
jgi:hypothetical protein